MTIIDDQPIADPAPEGEQQQQVPIDVIIQNLGNEIARLTIDLAVARAQIAALRG